MFTWDYSKCKDYKKFKRRLRKGEMHYSETQTRYVLKSEFRAIVDATLYIGIRKITEANYMKFYNRVRLHETLNGTRWFKEVRGKMVEIPTKLEDVKRMIGLVTNGSEFGAREFHSKFIKKHV